MANGFQPFGEPGQRRRQPQPQASSVGGLAAPVQAQVPQSLDDIPPEQRNDPNFQARLAGWMDNLKKPEVVAAILQFSNDLLNSQGNTFQRLGNATIGGLGAAGRVDLLQEQRQQQEQERQLEAQERRREQEQQAFERGQTERRTRVQERRAGAGELSATASLMRAGRGGARSDKELKELESEIFDMFTGDFIDPESDEAFAKRDAARHGARLISDFGWGFEEIGALGNLSPRILAFANRAEQSGVFEPGLVRDMLTSAGSEQELNQVLAFIRQGLGEGEADVAPPSGEGGAEEPSPSPPSAPQAPTREDEIRKGFERTRDRFRPTVDVPQAPQRQTEPSTPEGPRTVTADSVQRTILLEGKESARRKLLELEKKGKIVISPEARALLGN